MSKENRRALLCLAISAALITMALQLSGHNFVSAGFIAGWLWGYLCRVDHVLREDKA